MAMEATSLFSSSSFASPTSHSPPFHTPGLFSLASNFPMSSYILQCSLPTRKKSDSFSVLQLFVEMLRRGDAKPNEFVYPLVLRACSEESDLNLFKSVHGHAIKSLFGEFGILQSSLLDGYVRLGDVKTARELFDGMPERNIVCWTALVSGYARVGKVGNAIALFNQMPERDVPSWNAIISGCAHNGFNSEAVTFFQKMVESGARPNKTTIFCTLSACGHMGMLRLGKQMHGLWLIEPILALIHMLSMHWWTCTENAGALQRHIGFLRTYQIRVYLLGNSLINCFALQGHSEIAVSTFDRMQESGVVPDEITFVGLLNACTHGGFVNQGLSYFYNMTLEYGIEPSIEHYGCVIDLLSRAGRFIEAIDIINNMKIKPDEVIWGSILNGCRIYREKDLAEIATKKLLELDPNNADYTVILANMCSESGLWDEMRTVRKVMRDTESKKLPGCSWVEVNKRTWQFYSGDRAHPESDEIYRILDNLSENLESVSSM
ncbi:Pentatricopeptide repeat-containing protein [Rhynchospora pubera]|uniref:Pentatricopeptide repeat-containing protein n=1 Tax=Rhynchospora pubera TaxID=906938 RepID=A0AAV8ASC8_9POAL|nr:Pentatricopeptide repeat-containing protein [Rhynchospora pubera]